MSKSEVSMTGKLGLGGGIVPASLGLEMTLKRTLSEQWEDVLQEALRRTGVAAIEQRLAESPELATLAVAAAAAGARSSMESKRRLLGKVLANAVLDDAQIDESTLLVDLLKEVDAPHVRCLSAIHRAERDAKLSGEQPPVASGAEKPYCAPIQQAASAYPVGVLQVLLRLDLIVGMVLWDDSARVTGMTKAGERLLDYLADAE